MEFRSSRSVKLNMGGTHRFVSSLRQREGQDIGVSAFLVSGPG